MVKMTFHDTESKVYPKSEHELTTPDMMEPDEGLDERNLSNILE